MRLFVGALATTTSCLWFMVAGRADAQIPGGAFTTAARLHATDYGVAVAIGPDGLALISYMNQGLRVAHCSNPACTSLTSTTLDPQGQSPSFIAIGTDGLGLITYIRSPGTPVVAHCSDPACTTATFSTPLEGMYFPPAITIGADGLGLLSYSTPGGPGWLTLKVAHCEDLACTTVTTAAPGNLGNLGFCTSITTGADGLGLIIFRAEGKLKVAHCSNPICSSASVASIDHAFNPPSFEAFGLVIGADGLGLISYTDETGRLTVAHCSDLDCSTATTSTLVEGEVIPLTSLTLGHDGRALIGYSHMWTGLLYVARCSDVPCTTVTSVLVDERANWPTMALGGDGLPFVAYHVQPLGGHLGIKAAHQAPRGDFNTDGRQDLVWRRDGSGDNFVWFMEGPDLVGASFTNPALADAAWRLAGTNDFNGDAQTDLLWRHSGYGENAVWFMNGPSLVSGTFTTTLPDPRWQIGGTGDFDRDGRPDILWRHLASGENAVWYMNGATLASGTFLTPPSLPDVGWQIGGTGDFNRDGQTDILWHHQVSGQLVLWYMNGSVLSSGTFTDPPALPDTAWKVAAVGDYDANGRPDVVWHNPSSGQAVVWFMDDATLVSGTFTNPSTFPDTNWKLVGPR